MFSHLEVANVNWGSADVGLNCVIYCKSTTVEEKLAQNFQGQMFRTQAY